MEFRILGPVEVSRDGQVISLGGSKQRALLAILLLNANKAVSMERLTDLLWGDQAPTTAAHAIEVYVSQLRRALEPTGAPYRTLLTGPAGYTLRIDDSGVDAVRFEQMLDGAARLGPEARLGQLNDALGLWHGPALAEFASESFAVGEAARLNDLRLLAREERIDAELALGRHAAAVGELVALTNEFPLRERLCGQLMLALYRTGRQAEASDAYQRIRDHLVDDMGMEPGPELQALLRRILQQDPALNADDIEGHVTHGPRTNLPAQLTSFIGRRDQIAHIENAISEFRLLTLMGVGGGGKTRLALQVASRLLDRFPDGVWFIDLAPIADPGLIWQAIATSIGIREQAGRPLERTVKGHLQGMVALLVLDNCEHLIDAAAEAAETLLISCPTLRLIATSRERLKIPGEHPYEVPPLNLPHQTDAAAPDDLVSSDAVRLFADRAATAQASFSISGSNASAVGELCRRLDGIPLAIELAAARAQVLSPQELLVRVTESLAVLKADSRIALDRQRTLEQTIQWSYKLLTPDEQNLFDKLSVFAGTFDLNAVEAMAGSGALDVLASLIDKSLVIAGADSDGGTRYRVLEVLRQFGQSRLRTGGSLDDCRRRHAMHFVAVAQTIDRQASMENVSAWLPRLQRDEGNFRLALDWLRSHPSSDGLVLATSLTRYWKASGSITEGRLWLEGMIAAGSDDLDLTSVALYRAGLFAYLASDNEAAWNRMSASIELKRKLGDDAGVARRMGSLAQVAMARGDEVSAMRLATEGRALSSRVADARAQAWANVHMGFIDVIRDELNEAARLLTESLPALRSAGDYAGQAYVIGGLALIDFDNGDVGSVRRRLTDMFELIDRHTLWHENPGWFWGLLLLAEAEGRYETAARITGAIRQRERDGIAWHTRYVARYRGAMDRALRQVAPPDLDRLLREGASMTNAELMNQGLEKSDSASQAAKLSALQSRKSRSGRGRRSARGLGGARTTDR